MAGEDDERDAATVEDGGACESSAKAQSAPAVDANAKRSKRRCWCCVAALLVAAFLLPAIVVAVVLLHRLDHSDTPSNTSTHEEHDFHQEQRSAVPGFVVRAGHCSGIIASFGSYLGVLTARHCISSPDDRIGQEYMAARCHALNAIGGVAVRGPTGSYADPGPLLFNPSPQDDGFLFRGEKKLEGGDWVLIGLRHRSAGAVTAESLRAHYGVSPHVLSRSAVEVPPLGGMVTVHHFGGLTGSATPAVAPFTATMRVPTNQSIQDGSVQRFFRSETARAPRSYLEVGLFVSERRPAAGVQLAVGSSGAAYWNADDGVLVGIHRAAAGVGDERDVRNLATDARAVVAGLLREVARLEAAGGAEGSRAAPAAAPTSSHASDAES